MRDGLPSWRLPPLGECPETLKSGIFATVLQESAGTFLGGTDSLLVPPSFWNRLEPFLADRVNLWLDSPDKLLYLYNIAGTGIYLLLSTQFPIHGAGSGERAGTALFEVDVQLDYRRYAPSSAGRPLPS
jgi:hypothetical protein